MNKVFYVLMYVLSVFVCSCTQISLKKAATVECRGISIYLNKTVIISNVIFVGATFVSTILYRHIQFSTINLLGSLSYVFIPVLSFYFIKEKISKRIITGIILIIMGIAVYAVFGESI